MAFFTSNITGIHYAVRIFIGTLLLWILSKALHNSSSLWAIISLIIVTEPQMRLAWLAFRTRLINTFMGSVVGFLMLAFVPPAAWEYAFVPTLSLTALISTYINRVQQGWRIAPITTALVISAAMTQQSAADGIHFALLRTAEVFLGSAMALVVTVIMARIWLPPEPAGEAEKK